MSDLAQRVSVVMLTWNRREEVLRSLANAYALPDRVPLLLVDNGSTDGTAEAVRAGFPEVALVRLDRNMGAAGRNAGVARATTPYVAFCDDDTWWSPGAYRRAAAVLDAHPGLAAVTGRVLVGPEAREDEASRRMAASPLRNALGVRGSEVLGVMAGACMMRREAYLTAGGYAPRLFLGGEELLLALDLASAGWRMAYLPEVVVHHHPSSLRDAAARRRLQQRNALWCAWLRRPWRQALLQSSRQLRAALGDATAALAVLDAIRGLPWVLHERRRIPAEVERALQRVEAFYAGDWAREKLTALTGCRAQR